MSRARAVSEAKRLKRIMAKHGVEAVIDLGIGRPNVAGDDWYTPKVAIMNHHTAGPKFGKTPSLTIVKRGRPGLPGRLANGFGGRDHVYRILTMGLANHPGEGGPLTLAGKRIPKDSARISVWGTEWEHDGRSKWPPDMIDFMARANAALLEWMDRPVEASIEHKTWAPRRKIDRNGYTAKRGQREIRAVLKPPKAAISVSKVSKAFTGRAKFAPFYVARVQALLVRGGWLKGGYVKGQAGRKTIDAFRDFELSQGHQPNGKPTRLELERLNKGRYRIIN
jgi:hypothetical protein